MSNATTFVHVTHEAVGKIGGIGAVLQGLFTCKSYLEAVDRSILVSPLFTIDGSILDRLGENGEVLYSSIDGLINPSYAHAFHKIESFYNVGIVYGRRTFIDQRSGIKSSPEVLLLDIRHINNTAINEFKRRLFEEFGIRSHLYEHLWEYEQYVRLAPVAIDVLKALGAAKESTFIIAHEFMGMPTALAAMLEPCCDFRTVFYAHEVATMRRIVEEHPSHDTMFYNIIKQAHKKGFYVNEVFGDQSSYFKHVLVEASKFCNYIFAVGDHVVEELRFMAQEFETANIEIVYNGTSAERISITEKLVSKEKLQLYCENLLGFKPDYIFTHVTRLVRSKGLWRDLRVLYKIEEQFKALNKTAVLFVLSTEVQQRLGQDIYNMESSYNWPVAHREGWPDLSGGEARFYTQVQEFNAQCRNVKVIFINQFGFQRKSCGKKMPEDMEFIDIRKGTDLEFGQSVYEPFGISQIEPLTYGGICVFTNVCGCAGLYKDVNGHEDVKNVIIADYTNLADSDYADIEDLKNMSRSVREQIEINESEKIAKKIVSVLPKNESETENLIRNGYELARNMTWDAIVKNYILDILDNLQKTPLKLRSQ